MSSTSSPNVQHFRGRTLSPQSPIPVHFQEAHNIPVLENQHDPVFNLVSSHIPSHMLLGHDVPAQTSASDQDSSVPQPSQSRTHTSRMNELQNAENATGQNRENCLPSGPDEVLMPSDTEEASNIDYADPTSNAAPSKIHISSLAHNSEPLGKNSSEQADVASRSQTLEDVALNSAGKSSTEALTTELDVSKVEPGINVDSTAVDYQALLDNIVSSSSVHPNSNDAKSGASQNLSPTSLQTPIATLPIPAGLPARPPPQEKPAIHPNYDPEQDIQSYHQQYLHNKKALPTSDALPSNPYSHAQSYSSQNPAMPHSIMPVPPIGSSQSPRNYQDLHDHLKNDFGRSARRNHHTGDNGPLRSRGIETAYDEFLRAEADYTSQGLWEKFPHGSRLFVGNLFTEKVDKRDVFYIFHKYGKLAQISLKSAYGFVQFLSIQDCSKAIQCEQGLQIKGRKINLEISKPQKNTRNAATAIAAGESLRAAYSRRSPSPDYFYSERHRESSVGISSNRYNRGPEFGDSYTQSRENHRLQRSQSPRSDRRPDSVHGGSERRCLNTYPGRGRSRSPYNRYSAYRDRSPLRTANPRTDFALAPSKQSSGSAPDVQIILAEEVDRTFVNYVQQTFRDRSLRCEAVLVPRMDLGVLVRRFILEGVQAVVKIFRWSQISGRIPLQVFNRSQGLENVQFDEYDDLNAGIAAEIVVRAKTTHMAPPQPRQIYQSTLPHDVSHYGQQNLMSTSQAGIDHQECLKLPQTGDQTPILSNMISSFEGHDLQKLLASVSQSSHQVSPASLPSAKASDLSHLLSSAAHHHTPQSPLHAGHAHQAGPHLPHEASPQQLYQQESSPASRLAYSNSALSSSFHGDIGDSQPPLQATQKTNHIQPQHQNVQDIMAQLARYR